MENGKAIVPVHDDSEFAFYLDSAKFEHGQRVANMLAKSKILPKHYQNSIADCFIAISTATRLGVDPLQFMQKTYVVGGKIGIESQLAIALANKAKVFKGPIKYEYFGDGDGWQCRAWAISANDDSECEEICSVQEAKDMGWWNKSGSPWPKQTKKMLAYRAAINMIRKYHPEVLFGMDVAEDLRDEHGARPTSPKDITDEVNREAEGTPLNIAKTEPKQNEKPKTNGKNANGNGASKKQNGKSPVEAEEPTIFQELHAECNKNAAAMNNAQSDGEMKGGEAAKICRDKNDPERAAELIEIIQKYTKKEPDADNWIKDCDAEVRRLWDVYKDPANSAKVGAAFKARIFNEGEIEKVCENNDSLRAEVIRIGIEGMKS